MFVSGIVIEETSIIGITENFQISKFPNLQLIYRPLLSFSQWIYIITEQLLCFKVYAISS